MTEQKEKLRLLISELKDCEKDTELEKIFTTYIHNHPIHKIKKKFTFKGNTLFFAQKPLDLSKKEKIRKLLWALLDDKKLSVNKPDLIQAVYGNKSLHSMSIRQKDCLNHNIVKLISRTRKLLSKHYERKEIIWIPSEPAAGGWRLFSFRHPY